MWSGGRMGVGIPQRIVSSCTPTATGRSIAKRWMWHYRVPQGAFERLELLEGKLSRAVLRGLSGSNPARLPGGARATGSSTSSCGCLLPSSSWRTVQRQTRQTPVCMLQLWNRTTQRDMKPTGYPRPAPWSLLRAGRTPPQRREEEYTILKGCTKMALTPLRAASNLALQASGAR
jgi:hypothetical protein